MISPWWIADRVHGSDRNRAGNSSAGGRACCLDLVGSAAEGNGQQPIGRCAMRRRVLGVVGALVGLMCVGEVSASADPVVRNGPIAFAGDRTGNFEIYRMRQDGSHVRRLTHTAAGRASIFSDWSPDGRWIAFDSDRRGNVQLFVMNR